MTYCWPPPRHSFSLLSAEILGRSSEVKHHSRGYALAGRPGLWVTVRQVPGPQENTLTTGRDGRSHECGSTRSVARGSPAGEDADLPLCGPGACLTHLPTVSDHFLRQCPSLTKQHVRTALKGSGLLTVRHGRRISLCHGVRKITDKGGQNLPENPADIALSRQNGM
jgi:hypothetical protein